VTEPVFRSLADFFDPDVSDPLSYDQHVAALLVLIPEWRNLKVISGAMVEAEITRCERALDLEPGAPL
jgi:hypothetical protein